MPMGLPHRIAIVGAGLIGSALAGHLILAGNNVIIGARRPKRALARPRCERARWDHRLHHRAATNRETRV
jgi:predicted dinucleotide-binding enzyme